MCARCWATLMFCAYVHQFLYAIRRLGQDQGQLALRLSKMLKASTTSRFAS